MNRLPGLLILVNILLFIFPSAGIGADSLNLNVPYYAQGKNEDWADDSLGNKSSVTIRTHGCALTAISMITDYFYGENLTPAGMNRWLKNHDGFEDAWDGGSYLGEVSLNWTSLTGFGGGMVYTRFDWDARPADLALIKYYLEKNIPVIAEVRYRGTPHYVVLTGWDDQRGLIMNDPEFPEISVFNNMYNTSDQWGSGPSRNIYGIRVLYPSGYVE